MKNSIPNLVTVLRPRDLVKSATRKPIDFLTLRDFRVPWMRLTQSNIIVFVNETRTRVLKNRYCQ